MRLLQSEHESDITLKRKVLKSLNIKGSSKKVSLQLLSELRRVCSVAQIFRQVVPRRRTGVAEWTFAELCAQWEVRPYLFHSLPSASQCRSSVRTPSHQIPVMPLTPLVFVLQQQKHFRCRPILTEANVSGGNYFGLFVATKISIWPKRGIGLDYIM